MAHHRAVNLEGQKIGRLLVLSLDRTDQREGRIWNCRCDCGNHVQKSSRIIRNSGNVSCGCSRRDSIKNAAQAAWAVTTKFHHPEKKYLKWMYRNMVCRCHKPGSRRYERYGGRGIHVCDEWRTNPTAFFEWAAAHGYRRGMQIDRIDNDGNYEPSNCRFVTQQVNQNNTSRNRWLTHDGKTMTVAQWARALGISPLVIGHRLYRGWTVEQTLAQPKRATRCSKNCSP